VYDGELGWLRRLLLNLTGPVAFSQDIQGLQELLDKIRGWAEQHNIVLSTDHRNATPTIP
jgi:hypothetical protein